MFSHRLDIIKPSPTLAISAKANKLKAEGKDVINFSVGEPDFDTPNHIKVAANKAMAAGKTKYTAVEGVIELRTAISDKLKRENNLDYGSSEIIVGCGAKQVIFNAMMSTLNHGDEVVILAPYWVSYIDIILLAGGTPIVITCSQENDFKVTTQQLASAITPKTKWLLINSPNNPTGSVYSADELSAIANVLLRHQQVQILMDDIYEHIIFDDCKFYTLPQVEPRLKDRVLLVNGVSKAYSMTGWRIGYGAGNKNLINAMVMLQSQSTSNPCSISQYAAIEALSASQDIVREYKALFQKRRDLVVSLLEQAPGLSYNKPLGAFYLFIDCQQLLTTQNAKNRGITTSASLCEFFLDQELVAVVAGEGFGMEGFFRLSYAASDDKLIAGCNRIINVCKALC